MEVLTYCAHDYEIDHEAVTREITSISLDEYHYDKFRNTYILPLYNAAGKTGKVDPELLGKKKWSKSVPHTEKNFSSILEELPGRLTVLFTPAGQEMNIHLDCLASEVGTNQYKWRYVLKGDLGGLYFLDKDMNKIYPNQGERSYVMDGGHPHSIDCSPRPKWTMCIGAPWRDTLPEGLDMSKAYRIERPEIKESWGV